MSEVQSRKVAPRPTITILYYLLGNLRARWNAIGKELGVSSSTLSAIKQNHTLCYRRMIEMLESWIMLDKDCTWSAVVRALAEIGEKDLAGKVQHYTKELVRIEMSLPQDVCKRLVPMRQHSYENWCLDMATCEAGDEIESEQRIVSCLKQAGAATKWYVIGICLKISKYELDTIEDDYTINNPISKLYKMVVLLRKSRCKWEMLIKTLVDIDLNEAAESVKDLARKRGYAEASLKINFREFQRKDFISREHQLSIQDLRETLQIPNDVSNEKIFEELDEYYDRSADELKKVVGNVATIEEKCSEFSKEIEEEVNELAEELDTIKMVCASLEKQNKSLQCGKELLQKENERLQREISNTKVLQPELKKRMEEIEEIDKRFHENNIKKNRLKIPNNIVCKKLEKCQEHQNDCRTTLKRCRQYTTSKLETLKTDPNYRIITDDGKIIAYTVAGLATGAASGALIGVVGGPPGVLLGGILGGSVGAIQGFLLAGKKSELRYAYEQTFRYLDIIILENTVRVMETETRINSIQQLLASARNIHRS